MRHGWHMSLCTIVSVFKTNKKVTQDSPPRTASIGCGKTINRKIFKILQYVNTNGSNPAENSGYTGSRCQVAYYFWILCKISHLIPKTKRFHIFKFYEYEF